MLFDQGTPVPLRRALTTQTVSTAFEMGWAELENGQLLDVAEATFDVLITTDQNLRYQQNLTGRRLAILVVPTASWPVIKIHVAEVVAAVDELRAGEFRELSFSG
ncbi:MAG: hypothetical protein ACE5I7_20830 [Candidatus Binatia bacterium]